MMLSARDRTLVMGIVNVTPDSFSDGGEHVEPDDAVKHGLRLIDEGADLLDIGGESTRPGAAPVSAEQEADRVVPVIRELAKRTKAPISVDTMKASVAEAALAAGARIINDVSAATADPLMLDVAASRGAALILMHMQGEPRTMQQNPVYGDVVHDVRAYLAARAEAAIAAGVDPGMIAIDPGFGFGKTLEHNLTLLRRLTEFTTLGYPVLAGTSRKSFIGHTLDLPVTERLEGTAATVALAVAAGVAMVRVHDVGPMARVVKMVDAVVRSQ